MIEGFRAVRAALDQGEVSSHDLVRACLDRIDALDEFYAAWMHVDAERALTAAKQADARRQRTARSPSLPSDSHSIEGIPVGLKDNIAVEGLPLTVGSPAYRDRVAVTDAAIVHRMRSAGAIVVGKQRLHELGLGDAVVAGEFRTSRHPWNDAYVPGGSSCGSAVATRLGMCQVSVGGDTGGSVRNPAASCGVVGFKPTTGVLDGRGIAPLCWSMDTPGFLGRSVADALAAFAATVPDRGADATSPDTVVVGVPANGVDDDVVAPIRRMLEDVAGRLPGLDGPGIRRVEVRELPALPLDDAAPIWQARLAEMADAHAVEKATNQHGFGQPVVELLDLGAGISAHDYGRSWTDAARFTERIDAAFDPVDVLLLPTNPRPALPWSSWVRSGQDDSSVFEWYRFLWPFNVSGHAAVSLPWGLDDEGVPLSVQLVARRGQDVALLALAELLEAASPRLPRPPAVA